MCDISTFLSLLFTFKLHSFHSLVHHEFSTDSLNDSSVLLLSSSSTSSSGPVFLILRSISVSSIASCGFDPAVVLVSVGSLAVLSSVIFSAAAASSLGHCSYLLSLCSSSFAVHRCLAAAASPFFHPSHSRLPFQLLLLQLQPSRLLPHQ